MVLRKNLSKCWLFLALYISGCTLWNNPECGAYCTTEVFMQVGGASNQQPEQEN